MRDASGRQRKIIIFSEHRDTLNYLHGKIAGVLGNSDAIVTIHGGTHRDERRRLQALFRSDPDVRVLVATDAAGEGVNLQNANLDGQLRSALESEPAGAAFRSYSPHRSDRDLPPLEPRGKRNA